MAPAAENKMNGCSERPLKIDLHTHVLPKEWPDLQAKFGYPGWISLKHGDDPTHATMMLDGRVFRKVDCNCWDDAARAQDCERTDVDVQVLSTVPVMFSYWAKPEDALEVARIVNDDIAERVRRHPQRYVGLCSVPLQEPKLAVQELTRCMTELGMRGVEIGSHVNKWNLDAPELYPFWKACEDLGAAVFVHPWDMQEDGRMANYWFPWYGAPKYWPFQPRITHKLVGMPCETTVAICSMIFGGVFERFPRLKVAFAHGGGSFPGTLGRIQHGFDTRPDLCAVANNVPPMDYLGKFWVDSLVHDPDALKLLLKKVGANRVMLGSDYPFVLGEHHPGKLIETMAKCYEEAGANPAKGEVNMDRVTEAKLLGLNACEFLGVSREQFM